MEPQESDRSIEKQESLHKAGKEVETDEAARERIKQRAMMHRAGAVDIDLKPAKLGSSQIEYESGVVEMITLVGVTTAESGDSDAEASRSVFARVEVPARVYRSDKFRPLLEVVVPETYAKELEVVREQRLRLEGDFEDAVSAHFWLGSHPLGSRALPEDIFMVIDALPTKTSIRCVILSGEPNPYDLLYKQKYGNDFVSAADTDKDGTIIFYQCNFDRYLAEEMFHEWAHNIQQDDGQSSRIFDLATRLERDGYYAAREYAKNPGENWAVHLGEQLMGVSGANLWTFAHSAPIRAVVLARALRRAMERGDLTAKPGTHHEEWSERLRMIDSRIIPLARARLVEIASKPKNIDRADVETLEGPILRLGWWARVKACIENAHDAAVLLTFLGTPDDLSGLTNIVTLDLSRIPLNAEVLSQLGSLPSLRHLDISYTGIEGDATCDLRNLPLETLNMGGISLGNSQLYPLFQIKQLRSLDVHDTFINDGAVPILSHLTLDYLNVRGSRMTEEGKCSLKESLPNTTVET